MGIRNYKFSPVVLRSVFVVSIFLLFFTVSISYKQIQSLTDSSKSILHSHGIRTELELLLYYTKDAETNQRGYLLTHDTSFYKSYENALVKVRESFGRLKALSIDNPEQQKFLESLKYLMDQRFDMMASVIKNTNLQITISESLKKRLLKGKELMDKISVQTDKIASIEKDILIKREVEHTHAVNLSPLSFLLTALFSLFVFIIAFYRIKEDVKKLKRVNNQLLINQELFEHTEQIAEISSWFWHIDTNVLFYSDNQYRLLGCEPHEFKPTLENFIKFVHSDDRHIVEEVNVESIQKLTSSIAHFRVIRKDGEIRYFKSIGKTIIDNYRKRILIGINADITDQNIKDKILEEKLRDLERSNKELSAFNHVASHDLQEPLRKIQTLISRIAEKDISTLSEKGKEYFSRIRVAANRMQKLIDDLLLFSRTNKADKAFESTNLNNILENSKQELMQLIEEKSVTILSPILPELNVIPFQIEQLFINLIGNSIKYSKPDTAPVITIDTTLVSSKEIIGASASADKKFHKISFADNGIGFEQQYAESVFTLFQRLHDDKKYSGTGIGLTICKKIVENHNGFITAEATPNVGASFTVFLPS